MTKLTREEVLNFALKGGLFDCITDPYTKADGSCSLDDDLIKLVQRAYDAGVRAEREECAKVCDEHAQEQWNFFKTAPISDSRRGNPYTEGQSDAADECAAAIRARTGGGE